MVKPRTVVSSGMKRKVVAASEAPRPARGSRMEPFTGWLPPCPMLCEGTVSKVPTRDTPRVRQMEAATAPPAAAAQGCALEKEYWPLGT